MKIIIWKDNKILETHKVKTVSHFGVVRDYEIALYGGKTIELSADLVETIVKHETEEQKSK